jgi:hypothetical protein
MSVYRIFTTLCLVALCLGSAGMATAASVTGAGVIQLVSSTGPPPGTLSVAVSASSGPGGTAGTLLIGSEKNPQFYSDGYRLIANVVALSVVGNTAFGLAEITHTTVPDYKPIGMLIAFAIQDNGATGDAVSLGYGFSPLDNGNFIVTP